MKKCVALILAAVILAAAPLAMAENEELEALTERRNELLTELAAINAQRGALLKAAGETETAGTIGKIKDLFPDEALACAVRDKCGKFSIEQTVTADELKTITALYIEKNSGYGLIRDLTGIGYLENLVYLFASYSGVETLPEDMANCTSLECLALGYSAIRELPDWIGQLQALKSLTIYDTKIAEIPESIGDLTRLETLGVSNTKISALPDSIGDLLNLKSLNISETDVAELPDTIGNLVHLRELDISNTKITALPESVYNLQLTYLNMGGLPIK